MVRGLGGQIKWSMVHEVRSGGPLGEVWSGGPWSKRSDQVHWLVRLGGLESRVDIGSGGP